MYPIEFESLLNERDCLRKPILLFSCISFEERCKTSVRKIFELFNSDIIWGLFRLRDNGSHYEKECLKIQNKITKEIKRMIKINDIPEYDLFDSRPWEEIISYFKEIIQKNPDIETVIIDITTIPKVCYFPFLKWLIFEGLETRDLIICYTKPQEYGNSGLESDPINLNLLMGNYNKKKDILWIPLLGFNSAFTKTILEKLREMNREGDLEIIPMIGFPVHRPDYFDKCLLLHVKEGDPLLTKSLKKPILAGSDNPFDVYNKVMEIVKNNNDKEIILSPLGPKSMAIGFALASIKLDLPVFSIQPRTYDPKYSIGEGSTSAYWIKRDGEYTFNYSLI